MGLLLPIDLPPRILAVSRQKRHCRLAWCRRLGLHSRLITRSCR